MSTIPQEELATWQCTNATLNAILLLAKINACDKSQ